ITPAGSPLAPPIPVDIDLIAVQVLVERFKVNAAGASGPRSFRPPTTNSSCVPGRYVMQWQYLGGGTSPVVWICVQLPSRPSDHSSLTTPLAGYSLPPKSRKRSSSDTYASLIPQRPPPFGAPLP